MTKKVAIIGSGISGMTCGYLLHKDYDISVFEKNDYIGGHTATKKVTVGNREYAIDTGFIVFNDWTYPSFIKLMDQLGVKSQPTEMSFSVKNLPANLEYNGNNLNSLFAQRRNFFRPMFYRIVRDILRFNKLCKATYANQSAGDIGNLTLGEFLTEHKFSAAFADNYILPMCAAIWSTSLHDIKGFPLAFFLQFFNNHGLLNVTDRPQWYTIIGGSNQYVAPLTEGFKDKIKLGSDVTSVHRDGEKYKVLVNQQEEIFDEVIFACHSDEALAMIKEPNEAHRSILGDIPYADNDVVLHTDDSILPERKLAWASWNYLIEGFEGESHAPTTLTYDMNILQCIEAPVTFCVTLNKTERLDPDKILGKYRYAHPQFSLKTFAAQQRREEICGADGMHFCGAYWYNGFHEDGVRSALDVCARFGKTL